MPDVTLPNLTLFDADLRPAVAADPPTARSTTKPPAPRRAPVAVGPTLLAVDGDSLAHRAFHAYGDRDPALGLTAADGRPRGAVYGFLALLSGICDRVAPDGIVVGFDCRRRSDRALRYSAYKAQRPDKDPMLALQLADLVWLLERLQVCVVVAEGWEADDVLGSAAATAQAAGWRCVLATSDRDAYALVSPSTTLLRLRAGLDRAREMRPADVRAATGVEPEQYLELAALRGDPSDNLAGIPGIGTKRAAALLGEYPTVGDAVADPIGCRSVLGRPLGQMLLDDLADPGRSVFLRNVALMSIRRDLPVDLRRARPCATPDDIERVLMGQELPALVRRVTVALGAQPERVPPPGDADVPPMQ